MIPFLPFKTEQQQLTDLILLLSFKDPCHANPGALRKREGWNSYISRHIFQEFLTTSACNNVLFQTYKSWYLPKFFIFRIVTNVFCVRLIWRRGVVVITTAQLHSTKPELRFCAGSRNVGDAQW